MPLLSHNKLFAYPTMFSLKKVKPSEILLVLATVGSLFFLNGFTSMVKAKYAAVNTEWAGYFEKESQVVESLFLVKGHLGYGGIIHNFKNYVLRDDPKYLLRFSENVQELSESLQRLEALLETKDELAALQTIAEVVKEYEAKTAFVHQLHLQGLPIKEIDHQVKVDDKPAIEALKFLTHQSMKRAREERGEANEQMTAADNFLSYSTFVQIPLILLVLSIILILRALYQTSENALEAQKWADTLFETAPDAIICANPAGDILRSNAMAETLFGYSKEEFSKLQVETLIPPQSRPDHSQKREQYHHHPTSRNMGSGRQLSALSKDGTEISVQISLSSMEQKGEKIAIAAVRDVTEQELTNQHLVDATKEAEVAMERLQFTTESLIESEKQAATGQLVAGVAHEINTPIGICLSASTHLRSETVRNSKSYTEGELSGDDLEAYFVTSNEATRLINANLERAAKLVQSFKQVAVDQTGGDWRRFKLKSYIEEILISLNSIIKKSAVTVEVLIDEGLEMGTYPGSLFQCISNIVINGVYHGFDQGQEGRITVRAQDTGASGMISIEIEDNGKGIAPENQKKVFDPFFTTRRVEGGSGLGMSIVKKIAVYNLGGDITFVSEVNQGTTFVLTVPQTFKLETT